MNLHHLAIIRRVTKSYPDATKLFVTEKPTGDVYKIYFECPGGDMRSSVFSTGNWYSSARTTNIEARIHLEGDVDWSVYDIRDDADKECPDDGGSIYNRLGLTREDIETILGIR